MPSRSSDETQNCIISPFTRTGATIFIEPTVLSRSKKKSRRLGQVLVCRACDKSKGCEAKVLKSLRSRNDRNLIAEGKGVPCDRESEGSWRQTSVMTNRNLIQGLFFWVIEP